MSRRILVVGGTSAVAEATCRIWAAEGARLVLAGRDAGRLAVVAARLGGAPPPVCLVMAVDDPAGMASLVPQAVACLGGLDAVLVAHGSLSDQDKAQDDPAYLAAEVTTNFTSALIVVEAAARHFAGVRQGTIAVIGSVAGDRGKRRNYAYGACKAALDTAMQGLRHRFRGTGIRAVTIKPGPIDTPMTATHRKSALFASADQVGAVVARAVAGGPQVVYAPGWWRWAMTILKAMPEPIFTRLDL